MVALKHFQILLFLICLTIALVESKKKYPRIQDVVFFSDRPAHYISRVVKKIKSSVDMDNFKTNEALFRRQIRGNLDTILLKERHESRRIYATPGKNFQESDYRSALLYQFRTKILDCMLQALYMGRHFLKSFEKSEYLDRTTPSYRIGYIGRRLKHFFKKSIRILEILNVRQTKNKWGTTGVAGPLNLHHRVAKLHVEFNYFYDLLKRLHQIYRPGETPMGVQKMPSGEDDDTAEASTKSGEDKKDR